MVSVTVDGQKKSYPDTITLEAIAQEFQSQYEQDILLATVNGKLQELRAGVKEGQQISFLTAKEKQGMSAYRRSVIFMMIKAFYEVIGAEKLKKVSIEFAIGDGLFVETEGAFELTQDVIDRVKQTMQAYVDANLPIGKRSISTDEAIELFHKHRMYDKERLFRFRRASRVNIYSIGGFEDYYYGYMVQNTGYLKYFDLTLYQHGILLLLPNRSHPTEVAKVPERKKLYTVLQEAETWANALGVSNVAMLNEHIANGQMNDLMLVQEALMEKKIGDIAEMIASQPNKRIVMIAGPSSSGKTTFSHRLSIQLRAKGLVPHAIEVDNYFVDRVNSPVDEQGNYNYESLACLDVEQFNRDMTDLLAGKTVAMPTYNFILGEREYRGNTLTLGNEDILVIEGIHCLNEALSYSLPKETKFKIYISALTQLNIDEHNRIATTDGRLIRRIIRDARTRGSSAQDTIRMWDSVRRGEEENIFPYQEEADVMFNSALVYELAVLKSYAEPLLFQIPRESAEYMEAKRLLKFLDYFLGVSSEDVPNNSILREFIGRSCFKV